MAQEDVNTGGGGYVFLDINLLTGEYIARKQGSTAIESQPIWYDPETKKCTNADSKEVTCPDIIKDHTNQPNLGWIIATVVAVIIIAVLSLLYVNKGA